MAKPGDMFGELTLLEILPSRQVGKNKKVFWRLRCSCGKVKDFQAENVKRGGSKTCGCRKGGRTFTKPEGMANARCVFGNYQRGASKRGLSFEISFEDFVLLSQKACYFCGCAPSQIVNAKDASGEPRCNGPFVYTV